MLVFQIIGDTVLALTLFVVGRQVVEGRRAAYAAAFGIANNILQDASIRMARRHVFTNLDADYVNWSDDDRIQAEMVCQSYDSAAILCRRGLLPPDMLADSWGDSLRRSWIKLSPMICEYRHDRTAPELWDDFEWIAGIAERRPWKQRGRTLRLRDSLAAWIGGSNRPR